MDAFNIVSHRFLDIAALVPVPTNIANRDDSGQPKTTFIGGVKRLSFSSQFTKLGCRRGSRHGANLIRTKYLPALIMDQIRQRGADFEYTTLPDATEKIIYATISNAIYNNEKQEKIASAKKVVANEGDDPDELDSRATASLILVTQQEVGNLVKEIRSLIETNTLTKATATKVVKEAFANSQRSDQALVRSMYGRMVTNSPDMTAHPDGALQMGWPFSVEKAQLMSEYLTAVDDQQKRYKTDPGAGHVLERNQAGGHTMFLQFQIDLDLLAVNAGFKNAQDAYQDRVMFKDVILDTVESLVFRPFSNAASQGNFRMSPRASLAIARVSRNGSLYDFAPAFEKPIESVKGLAPSDVAAQTLLAYLAKAEIAYDESLDKTVFALNPDLLGPAGEQCVNTKETFFVELDRLLTLVLA